jgi:hypothetical protein
MVPMATISAEAPCPRIQAELLHTFSPVIRDAIKAGDLQVKAALYDIATGNVTLSEPPRSLVGT